MRADERQPGRSARLPLLLALALAALPAAGSAGVDDFFESDFDGNWVGTLKAGADTVPVQMSLNIQGSGGTALLRMPDADTGEPRLVEADFRTIKARKLIFEYEDESEEDSAAATVQRARRAVRVTVVVRYKAAVDRLVGKATGGLRGRLALERTDPDLPLGRLWSAVVKIGGESLDLRMALSEAQPQARSLRAANEVRGWAVLGEAQGAVTGARNGKSVDLTLELPSGDATADLALRRADNQLVGTLAVGATKTRLKAIPEGSNNGKPMKLRKAVPARMSPGGRIPAGATSAILVRGKNFGPGVVVHLDDAGVRSGTPTLRSPRALDVEVTVPESTAAGTEISMRLVNGDGQVDELRAALVVDDDGGGGGDLVSFAADIQPIFTANCAVAGCHVGPSGQAGLVLEPGQALGNIVNVPSSQMPALSRIAPGDPANSYLVRKIGGGGAFIGAAMPLGRAPLSGAQIQAIVRWVEQGAMNNAPSR